MKAVSVPSNWLGDIDGLTVADAIAYLSKLPQDHVLNFWMDGDTHGCDVRCELIRYQPYTEEERAYIAAERKAAEVTRLERQATYLENQAERCRSRGQTAWADAHQKRAAETRQRLKEMK